MITLLNVSEKSMTSGSGLMQKKIKKILFTYILFYIYLFILIFSNSFIKFQNPVTGYNSRSLLKNRRPM